MGLDYQKKWKNIVILGGSYGGLRAARVLADQMVDQPNYRIIVIDRNSHMNHLYVLPRYSVLPGHESKAFIPYTGIFREGEHRHQIIKATVLSMTKNTVTISPAPTSSTHMSGVSSASSAAPPQGVGQQTISFEFAIYALGASLPEPINVWKPFESSGDSNARDMSYQKHSNGSKSSSVSWLKYAQRRIQDCESVIVVGGGALGIQMASDIAAVHPGKRVTLLHSRDQLLPIYDPQVHDLVMGFLSGLNVSVVLNSRLSLDSMQRNTRDEKGQRILRTVSGEEFRADAVFLCTGSKGNGEILSKALGEQCVNPMNGLVRVLRTLQVDAPPSSSLSGTSFPHIFAIGDTADAFGAIKAGHTAYFQGEVAAKNIASLIKGGEAALLDRYVPGSPAIKVSVGLKHYVTQNQTSVYVGDDGKDDLEAARMWQMLGQGNVDFNL